jgi:hypothetical protein
LWVDDCFGAKWKQNQYELIFSVIIMKATHDGIINLLEHDSNEELNANYRVIEAAYKYSL